MTEKKIAHLEFIQRTITRFCDKSFLIKGWCVTLVAALTALSSGNKNYFILIAYLPIIVFWLLDSYYLWQERLYRKLYDEVIVKKEDDIDFSMKPSTKALKENTFCNSVLSKTIWPFYSILLATVLIFMFLFNYV